MSGSSALSKAGSHSSSAPFRWGLLGAARIARQLIPAIRAAGGEVALLGARDPASPRVRDFAREWSVPAIGTYQDVIEAELDAIYNPLPNDLHLPSTLAALRAGKHVLTEKPFMLNAAEAQRAALAAQENGRALLEAFAYRFQPWVGRLREIVESGELGTLRAVRGAFGFALTNPQDFRWEAGHGGGALYDVGCYPVSLIRLLLGEPQAVSALARWTPEDGGTGSVDMGLSGTLLYPHALADFSCAFDWGQPSSQEVSLVGTAGRVRVPDVFRSHTEQTTTLYLEGQEGQRAEEFPPSNGYALMVQHFQRVARGEEALRFPPQDAVKQARVLDALFESARSGARVAVTESAL